MAVVKSALRISCELPDHLVMSTSMRPKQICTSITLLILAAPVTQAQWSSNPAANLSIGDGASDQTQPKVVATTDGGVFMSWFHGIGSGFDVRVQRLDPTGVEVMGHQGTLVADRSFSSTQDYGLAVHASGDALLAFRDDRLTGTQITAARIAISGASIWGPTGIQLTSTTAFVAAPKIAGTSDGGAVVAWTQNSDVRVRKLDSSGTPLWAADLVLTPPTGSYSVADLHAAGTDVILSMVHQTGGFTSPKRLVAQKLNAAGAGLWGAAPKNIFDTGSLQFGNFPTFVPDGAGGAVFAWYTSSPLQCFAQRLYSNGNEAFPHNGTPVSTNATRIRVNPTVSFVPKTRATVVSWVEQNSGQSQFGLYSQKLDVAGNRQWGNEGVAHLPLGTVPIGNVRNQAGPFAAFVFWVQTPSIGTGTLRGLRLDVAGTADIAPYDIASTPSTKSRLSVAGTTLGQSILAWKDERIDSGDIYAQNVNCDGSLGAPSLTAPWSNVGNALAGQTGLPLLEGEGPLCLGSAFKVSLSNARPNTTAALIVGHSAVNAPLFGGVLVPIPDLIFFGLPTGPTGAIDFVGALPAAMPAGFEVYLQYWITDAAGPQGYAASNGLRLIAP